MTGRVPLAACYRPLLEGRPFIISFVTVAEDRFGGTHHSAVRFDSVTKFTLPRHTFPTRAVVG